MTTKTVVVSVRDATIALAYLSGEWTVARLAEEHGLSTNRIRGIVTRVSQRAHYAKFAERVYVTWAELRDSSSRWHDLVEAIADPSDVLVAFRNHAIYVERDPEETSSNWYIRVTAPSGCYAYDGWWRDSYDATWEDAVAEAKRGAGLL